MLNTKLIFHVSFTSHNDNHKIINVVQYKIFKLVLVHNVLTLCITCILVNVICNFSYMFNYENNQYNYYGL